MHLKHLVTLGTLACVPLPLLATQTTLTNADVAGNWKFLDLNIGTLQSRAAGTTDPFAISISFVDFENTDNILNADGTFIEVGFGTGRWFANNNVLFGFIDGDEELGMAFTTCNADTLGFTAQEIFEDTDGDGIEEIESDTLLFIGVREESILPADVPGEWFFFAYELQGSQNLSETLFLDSFNVLEGNLTLTPSSPGASTGTFSVTFTTVSNPSEGPPLSTPIPGTWQITGGELELDIGDGEILDFGSLSAGNDLFIRESLDVEPFPGGAFFIQEVNLLMKRPSTSPTFAQLADDYQVCDFTFNWDDDSALPVPLFGGAGFEISEVELRADGTGRFDVLDSSELPLDSDTFTYTMLGSAAGIQTTSDTDSETEIVRFSAELDFGYFFEIEDNPGLNETEDYNVGFVFRKPTIEGIEDSLTTGAIAVPPGSSPAFIQLGIQTEVGLCYTILETDPSLGGTSGFLSSVLVDGTLTPLPIVGNGSFLTVDIPFASGPGSAGRLYRWEIVPCPAAP
ncbi:MAG: hypothetical protein ACFBZ8_13550 [Opitutales bacterium]